MTTSSYGASSRQPVFNGTRRVPNLYQRTLADGSVAYDAAFKQAGKTIRHRLTSKTKTDAIHEVRALQIDSARGEYFRSPAAGVTLRELADRWLDHLDARVGDRDPRRRRSARTIELYRQRLRDHICRELGGRAADSLTVADVRHLTDVLGRKRVGKHRKPLSPSVRTSCLNILSGCLRFGIKEGLVEHNPVRDLDRDDRPGAARLTEPRYLTVCELGALLGAMGDTFRPVAAACTFAGLRVSEALGLRWSDVDLKGDTLTVSGQLGAKGERVPAKTTASVATLPIVPALKRELLAHRSRQAERDLRLVQPGAFVFVTAAGRPQGRVNVLRAVQTAALAVGLNDEGEGGRQPVGVHDLRHSYVAAALDHVSIAKTAALARHASPRVTLAVYGGVVEQARESAAAELVAGGFGR